MIKYLFLFFCIFSLDASNIAHFKNPRLNRNIVFCLSTPKSGSNLITGCLSAITRKPISWFYWADSILDPTSKDRQHISYNRLGLPLVSDIPLLYRTHYEISELMKVPSTQNKLIFITRNPKELIYRKFFLQTPVSENPDIEFIADYLDEYLESFKIYDTWFPDNRMVVYYEDFILQDDQILLQLLQFINEPPVYIDDFLEHKQEYLLRLLQSYSNQHTHNNGGSSSQNKPKAIYYTQNASHKTLKSIDDFIIARAPIIWEKYLKRYKEVE